MSFGNVLRKLRKDKGMTQAELAKELGCTRQVIIRYETNKAHPRNPSAVYEELGRIFGVDPAIFTEEKDIVLASSIKVDFKQIIKYSMSNEELAGTFTALFDWIENNINKQISLDDKSGIEEFRKAVALLEEQRKITEQIKAVRRTYGCDDQSIQSSESDN